MNAKSWGWLLAACVAPGAHAATVLEYTHEGRCETDFERMAFDGLNARIDSGMGGSRMSTIFDDGEQLMYLLMHDSKQTMTMESDDDAVDFQSDVGRSAMLYSSNQLEKLTGMDQDAMMAQAQQAMAAACPGLAGIGFSDPDYAAAAQKCTDKMGGSAYAMDERMQKDMLRAVQGKKVAPRAAPSEPVRWSTTDIDRDGAKKTVAGIECTVETTRRGDTVLREQCMAAVESLGLDARAMRRLQRITKVGRGMSAGIASVNPAMASPDAGQPPKLALERTCYENGRVTGSATVRIDRQAVVDPAQFTVPAGYAPLSMEMPGAQ